MPWRDKATVMALEGLKFPSFGLAKEKLEKQLDIVGCLYRTLFGHKDRLG